MKHVMAWKLAMTVGIEEEVNEPLPTTMAASIGSKATNFFFFLESKNNPGINADPARLCVTDATNMGTTQNDAKQRKQRTTTSLLEEVYPYR